MKFLFPLFVVVFSGALPVFAGAEISGSAATDGPVVTPQVIVGDYQEFRPKNSPRNLSVDLAYQVWTDLEITDGNQHAAVTFPQPLRLTNEGYFTTGEFVFTYYAPNAIVCAFKAKLKLVPDTDGQFVDATLTIPSNIGYNSHGRCLSKGANHLYHVFKKVAR